MAIAEQRVPRMHRTKPFAHAPLFPHSPPRDSEHHFERLFQKFKQECHNLTKKTVSDTLTPPSTSNPDSNPDLTLSLQKDSPSPQPRSPRPPHPRNDSNPRQIRRLPARAFSSTKLQLCIKKNSHRKAKKTSGNLFLHARVLDKKESNSKKSTDDSNSGDIEQLRHENQHMKERIEEEERRLRKLEQAIQEENKRNELQKYLYRKNIEKLRKVAGLDGSRLEGILENEQSMFSALEEDQYDCLSIESH